MRSQFVYGITSEYFSLCCIFMLIIDCEMIFLPLIALSVLPFES